MANDWVDVPEPKSSVTVEGADPLLFGTAAGATALGGKGIWDTKKAFLNKEGFGAFKPTGGGLQGYINGHLPVEGVTSRVTVKQLGDLTGIKIQNPTDAAAAIKALSPTETIPGTPAQRVPHTKMINGVPTITHYAEVPGKPEIPGRPRIDLENVARQNYGPVQKQLAELGFEKPIAKAMKYAAPVLQYAAKPLAIAGGVGEFQDAHNRYKNEDYLGAGISAIGGLGSLATMVPHPLTKAVGTGLALGAPALNYGIDKFSKPKQAEWTDAPEKAQGGSVDMPAMAREIMQHHLNYRKGGDVKPKHKPKYTINTLPDGLSKEEFTHLFNGGHIDVSEHLAEGGQPPKPEANEGSAFVGYPQINRNRKVGSGTGFLDAALGAPSDPNRSSVLNPSNASYLEGYEKGEPYGIAGMALPFAGMAAKPLAKALGPKAASMAEDYLTQIGGIAHAVPKAKMSPGMSFGETFSKSNLIDPLEKLKYDRYKMSQVYPDVIPPVLAKDPKTGKEFLQKANSPEALEVQKARKAAQKEIDKGNYEPHFDVNQRYYADPTNYPTAGYTQTDIVPKKAETIAKYTELANNPESLARLRGAFEKGKDRPAAKDWYAMGQLEEAFIKELGVEEGRKQFKNRFADAMAATTGGADPNSNLMMAAFTNYQKSLGKEIPTKAADLPFPIGGRFVSGNMDQAKKLAEMGEIPVTNPKRHNFSANFLGHRDVSTIDEQMSQLWDPKMMSPPPNAYGIYQKALADEAAKAGVNPSNFQDVAWAGAKDYPGKPMMQEINEMLARTSKITGEPQENVLKGFIHGNKPMYGIGAAGVGAATQNEDSLPHFQVGGLAALIGKALVKHPHGQDARVAQALEEYLKGNISQADRINILNQHLPIRKWDQLPPNYTDEQIRNALTSNKQPKALAPVPAGMQVGNRLDIPAYTQNGVYVDTTHDAANKAISYGRTGHLSDVDFSSKPNQAVRVGLGTKEQALTPMGAEMGSAKSPFAMIKGTNVGTSDEEVRRMMAEMMKDPNYTQIGMDPRRHSQFYDKSTGMPVFSAEEKLQSGPLIIAPKRGLETTSWDDPRLNLSDFPGKQYKKGGKVKKK